MSAAPSPGIGDRGLRHLDDQRLDVLAVVLPNGVWLQPTMHAVMTGPRYRGRFDTPII